MEAGSMGYEVIELVQGKTGIEIPLASGNWVMLREEGYSPVQSLAAAVGACGAYVYQSVLNNSKVPYKFQRVTVNYKRDEERQSQPLKEIEIIFYVEIAADLQERALRAAKLIGPNCPVMQSLDPQIKISEVVEFI